MGLYPNILHHDSKTEHDSHVKVLQFCREQKVSLPVETAAYFGDESEGIDPNCISDNEVEELLETDIKCCVTKDTSVEMQERWEIDVSKIPRGVTRIRFTNSY